MYGFLPNIKKITNLPSREPQKSNINHMQRYPRATDTQTNRSVSNPDEICSACRFTLHRASVLPDREAGCYGNGGIKSLFCYAEFFFCCSAAGFALEQNVCDGLILGGYDS